MTVSCFRFAHYISYTVSYSSYYIFPCLSIQSLSKNSLLLCFRFIVKAFAKVRQIFQSTKFSRSFFSKKISVRTAEAISRSLVCLQDKILFTVPAVLRMSSLLAFSLESGCKGTHFFLSRKYINRFFWRNFKIFR